MSNAKPMAMGTNRVVLGTCPRGGVAADGGSEEEHRADVAEVRAAGEARDVKMTETETEIATTTATEIETETELGALAINDLSDPA